MANSPINATDPSGEFLNLLAGGAANVAIGYGISWATGQSYGFKDAAIDFGIGFATSGVAAINAVRRGAQITEGVYVTKTPQTVTYVGQSGNI